MKFLGQSLTDFTSWSLLRGTFLSWQSERGTAANDLPRWSTETDFPRAAHSLSWSREGTRHPSPGCHRPVITKKKITSPDPVYKIKPHLSIAMRKTTTKQKTPMYFFKNWNKIKDTSNMYRYCPKTCHQMVSCRKQNRWYIIYFQGLSAGLCHHLPHTCLDATSWFWFSGYGPRASGFITLLGCYCWIPRWFWCTGRVEKHWFKYLRWVKNIMSIIHDMVE